MRMEWEIGEMFSIQKSILCRVINAISFVLLVIFLNWPFRMRHTAYRFFNHSKPIGCWWQYVTNIKILSKYSKRNSAIQIVTKLYYNIFQKNFSFEQIFFSCCGWTRGDRRARTVAICRLFTLNPIALLVVMHTKMVLRFWQVAAW